MAPDLLDAQLNAGFAALGQVGEARCDLRLLVPMVTATHEITHVREACERAAKRLGVSRLTLGAMIETPRAALISSELARAVDFLSFGTNDLTQFVWGMDRDAAELSYLSRGGYRHRDVDPFRDFDEGGVGRLIRLAVRDARSANPAVGISVCGEIAAKPDVFRFFRSLSCDYVSCSAPNLASTRLLAGQEALRAAS